MIENPDISIIIRAKDEEKWLGKCIKLIKKQKINRTYLIVVVDSKSKDKTVEIAKINEAKIVLIDEYKPGYAINQGVKATNSKIIVLLSAHCLPADDLWLNNLTHDLFTEGSKLGAVYGRQLPTPSSNANDIRDLAITFGVEDKIQRKDAFFHNANSAFTRIMWEEQNFDNDVTNIEDRLWAEKLIAKDRYIKYKSNACVFHWHGIHQYGNNKRAEYTARILRNQANLYDKEYKYPSRIDRITAIVTFHSEHKDEEHQKLLLYKLLTCLGKTKEKWTIIVNSAESLIDEERIPENTKYLWTKK